MRSSVLFCAMGVAMGAGAPAFASQLIHSYAEMTPSITLDFDGLAVGPIAYPSAIVPGAAFSNDAQNDLGALFLPIGGHVVDEGGGDLALNLIDAASAPTHKSILIKFDTEFTAFAATWTHIGGGDTDGNPAFEVFDASGNLVESFGGGVVAESPDVFGIRDMATPGTYIAISFSVSGVDGENWNVDDLAVQYVPAPGAIALFGAAGAAVLRRRR